MVTQAEFEELTKDPDVYYFVYNTDENLAFVTANELNNYYTKSQVEVKIIEYLNDHQADGITKSQADELYQPKGDYYTKSEVETTYATKAEIPQIWTGTQEEYDAIETKSETTLYIIK